MTDKLTLLQANDLNMGEVVVFERKSGWTINELSTVDENAAPLGVVMVLAYLTERRANPRVKWSQFEQMDLAEFDRYFNTRFDYEVPDLPSPEPDEDEAEDDGSADPT